MTFQNKVRIRELNDAFCRREGVREQDGQQSLGFQARPGTRRTAQGTFDYPPATAGSAQLIHTRFRSSVEQRAFFAFIEVNEPEGSPVSDRNRDSEDIGRAINIIIQAMGRTPYSNPREASAKFATDDLTQFRSELPIEDQSVALPGAPRFTFQSSGQIICGGSGVVFQVRDPDADRHYALKFVRPSFT